MTPVRQINDPHRKGSARKLMAFAISCMALVHPAGAAPETSIPKPVIPDRNFTITEHGATGDGVMNNARAFQQTI
ncbi:MAG: hypothetical protein V4819_09535, partial [Verrucomicrobiota bacterium]